MPAAWTYLFFLISQKGGHRLRLIALVDAHLFIPIHFLSITFSFLFKYNFLNSGKT